jgi:hypothetical protein
MRNGVIRPDAPRYSVAAYAGRVVSIQLFSVFGFDNAFDNRKYVESSNSAGKGEDGLRARAPSK